MPPPVARWKEEKFPVAPADWADLKKSEAEGKISMESLEERAYDRDNTFQGGKPL